MPDYSQRWGVDVFTDVLGKRKLTVDSNRGQDCPQGLTLCIQPRFYALMLSSALNFIATLSRETARRPGLHPSHRSRRGRWHCWLTLPLAF